MKRLRMPPALAVGSLTDRLVREDEIAQAIGIVLGRKIQHTHRNLKEILMEDDDFIEEVMEYMRTHGL